MTRPPAVLCLVKVDPSVAKAFVPHPTAAITPFTHHQSPFPDSLPIIRPLLQDTEIEGSVSLDLLCTDVCDTCSL